MRALLVLLFLLNFNRFANGCLKVNPITTTTQNPCQCKAYILDDTNIRDHIKSDNSFYLFLSIYTFRAPIMNIEDCSLRMYCDVGFQLQLFDNTSQGKGFGEYEAEGICNPTSQKWLVDTLDGFTEFNILYGTCFAAPTTTTRITTPTTTKITTPKTTLTTSSDNCECEIRAFNESTIVSVLQPSNPYYYLLGNVTFHPPVALDEGCSGRMWCAGVATLLFFDNTSDWKQYKFGPYAPLGKCNPLDQTWSVEVLHIDKGVIEEVLPMRNQMWGVCYLPEKPPTTPTTKLTTHTTTMPTTNHTTPIPANTTTVPPGSCLCTRVLLDSSNIRNYVTDDSDMFYPILTSPSIVTPINQTDCSGIIFCPETHHLLIFDDTGLGWVASHFSMHTCDPTTRKWSALTGSRAGPVEFRQIYAVCLENGDDDTISSTQAPTTTTAPTTSLKDNYTSQSAEPTVTPTSTTTGEPTTTTEFICLPTMSRTFLFGYSTDYNDPSVVTKVFNNVAAKSHPIYTRIALIRLDLETKENFTFHNSWEEANATLLSRLPDPSLGYKELEIPTDAWNILERFVEYPPEIRCGFNAWFLMKRGSAGSRGVSNPTVLKIRASHGTVETFSSITKSYGSTSFEHSMSFMTNGMNYVHFDEDLDRATKFIQTPALPFLYNARHFAYNGLGISYLAHGMASNSTSTYWFSMVPFQSPYDRLVTAKLWLNSTTDSKVGLFAVLNVTRADMDTLGVTNHYGGYHEVPVGRYSVKNDINYTNNFATHFSQVRINGAEPIGYWTLYYDNWNSG